MKNRPTLVSRDQSFRLRSVLCLLLSGSAAIAQTLYVPGGSVGSIGGTDVGIGTSTPSTALHVVGPITAGDGLGSPYGVDYLYGHYGSGKLFVIGSQHSSAASFLGYAVKAKPGAVGYLSSTGITVGRSAIEANSGHVAFLTGSAQTSTDGGAVTIAERMRIDASGNIGIGSVAPSARLYVLGDSTGSAVPTAIFDRTYGTAGDTAAAIRILLNGCAGGGYLAGYNGDFSIAHNAEYISGTGYVARQTTASQIGQQAGNIYFHSNSGLTEGSAFTPTVRMYIEASSGNVGIGTASPSHKLAVNGTIRAKEVIVNTGWSDYVFADDYRLAPLSEVESHIREKKHLPGIPSAAEVEAGGVSLGDMQAKLLAKVEELTLHLIRMEKDNADLRRQLSALNPRP